MARGGPRPNAGRKPGASVEKTRAVANKVSTDGDVTPLEVMIESMRYFFALAKAGDAVADGEKVLTPSQLYVLAADAANKAAPFIHPKLSSVEMNANVTNHEAALDDLE